MLRSTPTNPVPFRLSHDGETVGHVIAMTAFKEWHYADVAIEDGPLQKLALERVKPGAHVSLGARSLSRYENKDLCIVRHTVCRLDEIALVGDGEIAGHIGAMVTRVWRPKPVASRAVATPGEIIGGEKIVRLGVGEVLAVR